MNLRPLLVSTAVLALAACAEPHPDDLEISRREWNRLEAEAPGYTYARYFESWTGTWFRTTVSVEGGVVVARSYEDSSEVVWIETGAELGSHEAGYDALTMPELYEECRDEVLTQDPESNEVVFLTDERGLLQTCTYRPLECDDDCTLGIAIESVQFDGGCDGSDCG